MTRSTLVRLYSNETSTTVHVGVVTGMYSDYICVFRLH